MSATRGRQRFTRDSARAALVEAGRQILLERGIAPGLERVSLKEAIERSGVPRTTAYRVFDGTGGSLADFHNAILAELDTSADIDQSLELVAEVLEQNRLKLESGNAAAMAEVLREIIRTGFNSRVTTLMHHAEWRAYVSSTAGVEAGENTLTRSAAEHTAQRFVPMFETLGSMFGLRPIPPLTWTGFVALLVAALDGAALRTLVDPSFGDINRPFEPSESGRTWNGMSITAEALLLVWTEPAPNARVTADLGQWTKYNR